MDSKADFSRVRTSWTKFDIVQVMDVIDSLETLIKYVKKEAIIDEPILRSFLGVKNLSDPIPGYWLEIQKFPKEKPLFALFAVIFTHGEIVRKFAEIYCTGDMKGVFKIEPGKEFTNIRSALIESGAAQTYLRRSNEVPFDFSPIFQNLEVGKLFRSLLVERLSRITNVASLTNTEFLRVCYENNFDKALSLSPRQFEAWLDGKKLIEYNHISKVSIKNFYSIKEIDLSQIDGSKEVYFLGENGDGKSLILMAIFLCFNRFFVIDKTDKKQTGEVIDLLESSNEALTELIGEDDSQKVYGNKNVGYLNNFYAYGTHRGRFSTDDAEEYGFMSLFDNDQTLINPGSWLKNQLLLEFEKNLDKNNMSGEIKALPKSFSTSFLEKMFHDLLEKNVEVKISGSEGVSFIEKGARLTFDQLSEGYRSIIIFMSDLLSRLQKNNPDVDNLEDFHGIVMVDEIDLHLHPKWQRSIIKKLRSLLPNIQFIFTTHSPNIIQGASDDAIIYRVYRNSDDGYTQVSDPYYRKDLNHLMINTLLTSPLFGLDNSRLDSDNETSDTSETYLLYRINSLLENELEKQKESGKEFISDSEIDSIIKGLIDEELGGNDKNQ